MGKQFLVAVDLEGIHDVVGVPYEGLHSGTEEYAKAVKNAIKEVNAVAKGLFDGGAELVAVWDNHAGGGNLDFSKIDSRIIKIEKIPMVKYERLKFAQDFTFDGILYVGYHTKEGTINGVLAHTYNSKAIQYFKVNNRTVGEIDIDSWAAAEYNIAPLFCASDDICVEQALEIEPKIRTVITKFGMGRNSAIFRDESEVLTEMYEQARSCVNLSVIVNKLVFPAKFEVRYTRTEDALKYMEKARSYGQEIEFGEDAHIIKTTLHSFADLETFL